MHERHEPDPAFVDRLEWQVGTELRRGQRATGTRRQSARVLKIAGLMIGSVALGAAGMGASQQLSEAWRKELLEARLEVQLELAKQRLQQQRQTIELAREQIEQGLLEEGNAVHLELQLAQAEAEARVTELELEEVRSSGKEPLGELSSPLVNGRDFVSERIRIRLEVARRHLEARLSEAARMRDRAGAGVVGERDLQASRLATWEAELQVEAMTEHLEIRRSYLDGEISAVEAELRLLEVESENRITLLQQQLEHFQAELERYMEAVGSGTGSAVDASHIEMRIAQVEGQLRLAMAELAIVRRELERRAG